MRIATNLADLDIKVCSLDCKLVVLAERIAQTAGCTGNKTHMQWTAPRREFDATKLNLAAAALDLNRA